MSKGKKLCTIIYLLMVFLVIGMVVAMGVSYQGESQEEEAYQGAACIDEQWVDENLQPVDTTRIYELTENNPEVTGSIYYTLPDEIEAGTSLAFRTTHIYYQVYLDGELVYAPYFPQSILYNKTTGCRWNFITLEAEDAGAEVEIRFNVIYENESASIDQIYLGSARGIVLHLIVKRIPAFITSILLLFFGFLLLIMDIPFSIVLKKKHEMLYLGLLSICVASWSLVDMQLFQLFLGNSRLLHVLACYDIILLPIPAILYIDEAFTVRRRFAVYGICTLSILDFILATGLHLFGIADLRETLFLAHFLMAVCAIVLFVIIIRDFIVREKTQKVNIYQALPVIGIICFAITVIIDLIRFWRGRSMDSGLFARIGLLIFVLCYSVSSLDKIVQTIKMGAQAEFISQLAYRDGLTGIGNRTAFQELMTQLQELETQKVQQQIGILMFDVNELKAVNDHLGHSVGDRMILETANHIKDAFIHVQGQSFRIGGDEFVVILTGDNIEERYMEGLNRFDESLETFNRQSDREFYLSVAKGCSIYDSSEPEKELFAAYQEADAKMYENKKKMKLNQRREFRYDTEKLSHAASSLR